MSLAGITALFLLFATPTLARGVRVEFDPTQPSTGPFPTDFLTTPDERQITGRRVQLPLPDCDARPGDCAEIRLINQLDGFHVNPRFTVRFSGAIDMDTLRGGIEYVWLDQLQAGRFPVQLPGHRTSINQVIYDPAANTAYGKPDEIFEGARRYLLLVTDAVRDTAGDPVEADPGFTACLAREIGGSYCERLAAAVDGAAGGRRVVGASLFTTLNVTSWYERTRDLLTATQVDFRRNATNPVVPIDGLREVTYRQHVATSGADRIRDFTIPAPAELLAQGGVGRIAFASIRAPRFVNATGSILTTPTGAPLELPLQTHEIHFHVWLPSTPPPAGGYPVAIAGHGLGDSRFGMPTVISLGAGFGYAVVAMSAFGHGYGPESSLRLARENGPAIEIPAPGRALDLNNDGRFDASEGCIVLDASAPSGARDCIRQTVADYFQLIRAIKQGMDLDGDGRADLSTGDLVYIGQSLGGAYGTVLSAVAPEIRSTVLNVAPGFLSETARLSPEFRDEVLRALSSRRPALAPVDGDFTGGVPLRYEAVRLRTAPGLADLQDFYERTEWLEAPGAPAALAPHLKQATLPGSPVKNVLFQVAFGDRTVPNPSSATLIRAANLREQTSLYRNDLAREALPGMPANPHTFLIPLGTPGVVAVATAALGQALDFLTSGREFVPNSNLLVRPLFRRNLFEVPEFLPETLNFATAP